MRKGGEGGGWEREALVPVRVKGSLADFSGEGRL